MSFAQRLKTIENLIYDDSQKCIRTISCKKFINSLFYQELKSFAQMFEQVLAKKGVHVKGSSEGRNLLRPQLVVSFYSIIIMRANMVCIRQSTISSIATKADQFEDIIYNSKIAIENLSKIYRSLEDGDKIRLAIVGLLLKVKGFNNYKMIAKDLHPDFVSQQTLDTHFQALKTQCPNLLETQIVKHKQKWSKYLKFKTLSMTAFEELVAQAAEVEKSEDLSKWDELMQSYEVEAQYLLNRLKHMENSQEVEKVNIDDLINSFDSIYARLIQKLKENSINPKKTSKVQVLSPEYDYKQFVLRNYIKIFGYLLIILNKTILTFHINWVRKIKWLYNFIVSTFANFNIKTTVFHASVALEYSRIITFLIQIILSYLTTFKNGLFPTGKLEEFAFVEEFSVYKLVEALLYNDYPFEQSDAIVFQNYQKQRKTGDNKHKQHIIDIVNFSMNSLNINPHWDSLLVKLIPNLKHSHLFAKDLVNTALYFLLQYFKITHDYQHAPKLLLMLANAKNTFLSSDRRISKIVEEIRHLIYPGKEAIKEGIEYFCEEYFNEYIKVNLKKKQHSQEPEKPEVLEYFEPVNAAPRPQPVQEKSTFRKTESRDAILEGWSQNFESVKDSPVQEIKASSSKNQMNQSSQVLNSEIFYSVRQAPKDLSVPQPEQQNPQQDGQILLPQF